MVWLFQFEDDEAAEEFKIRSLIHMVEGLPTVGIPFCRMGVVSSCSYLWRNLELAKSPASNSCVFCRSEAGIRQNDD